MNIKLPKDRIPNPTFPQTMGKMLPKGWTTKSSAENWEISPPDKNLGAEFFTNIRITYPKKGNRLRDIISSLQSLENKNEHMEYLEASNLKDFVHNKYERYGLISEIYAIKTRFSFIPLSDFDAEFEKEFEDFCSDFDIREAVSYQKNTLPFYAIMAIKKFAYQLPRMEKNAMFDGSNSFFGSIPHPIDFATYLDPFIVISPVLLALPIDRLTTGTVLIPQTTIVPPFEANVGLAEVMLSTPSGMMDHGVFHVFGEKTRISNIQCRRYVDLLLKNLNSFLNWSLHPKTSMNDQGIYDEAFSLQLIATVHSIFSSFNMACRNVEQNERMVHVFMAFDRLSNLTVNYGVFDGTIPVKGSHTKESEVFSRFFTKSFFLESAKIVKYEFGNKELGELLFNSSLDAYTELESSISNLKIDLPELIRTIRNTSHGAFLKKDGFLASFSRGEVKISHKLPLVLYTYMLALIISPQKLLKNISEELTPIEK